MGLVLVSWVLIILIGQLMTGNKDPIANGSVAVLVFLLCLYVCRKS